MKTAIARSKSILIAICLILTIGKIAAAQQQTDSERTSSPQTETTSNKTPPSEEEKNRFYRMTSLAVEALVAGETDKASEYARTLLKQSETMQENWNYGNALHVANLVLGHIAFAAGDVAEAKRFLLAAGKTPGSAQLNSFGPNMRLAKALLEKGETEVVIEYFDLCAKFWSAKIERLEEWKAAVQKNEIPDFGANLRYQFPQ